MVILFSRFCDDTSNFHIIEISYSAKISFRLLDKMVIIAFAYKLFRKNGKTCFL